MGNISQINGLQITAATASNATIAATASYATISATASIAATASYISPTLNQNLTVNGDLTATSITGSFSGNGSGITNLQGQIIAVAQIKYQP